MRYRLIVLEYGENLGPGVGAYEHPDGDGGTCALQVMNIEEVEGEDAALAEGIWYEEFPYVHSCIVEEVENEPVR